MNSTQNTAEGWGSLLKVLTEEELGQYGEVARDQINRELRWRWLQIIGAIIGAVILVWLASLVFSGEIGNVRWILFSAVALGLAYWPYRSAKTKRLWRGHYQAVQDELKRRQKPGLGPRRQDD